MHTITMKNLTNYESVALKDIVKIEIYDKNSILLTEYPPTNLVRLWDEAISHNASFIKVFHSDGNFRDFPISQWICVFSK